MIGKVFIYFFACFALQESFFYYLREDSITENENVAVHKNTEGNFKTLNEFYGDKVSETNDSSSSQYPNIFSETNPSLSNELISCERNRSDNKTRTRSFGKVYNSTPSVEVSETDKTDTPIISKSNTSETSEIVSDFSKSLKEDNKVVASIHQYKERIGIAYFEIDTGTVYMILDFVDGGEFLDFQKSN